MTMKKKNKSKKAAGPVQGGIGQESAPLEFCEALVLPGKRELGTREGMFWKMISWLM